MRNRPRKPVAIVISTRTHYQRSTGNPYSKGTGVAFYRDGAKREIEFPRHYNTPDQCIRDTWKAMVDAKMMPKNAAHAHWPRQWCEDNKIGYTTFSAEVPRESDL